MSKAGQDITFRFHDRTRPVSLQSFRSCSERYASLPKPPMEIEFAEDLSPEAIENFLNFCQLFPYEITPKTVFDLRALAHEWEVNVLKERIEKWLGDSSHDDLLVPSLIDAQKRDFDTTKLIHELRKRFFVYVEDPRLLDVPVELMRQLIRGKVPHEHFQQLFNFLVKYLKKCGSPALVLFHALDVEQMKQVNFDELCDEFQSIWDFMKETASKVLEKVDRLESKLKSHYDKAINELRMDINSLRKEKHFKSETPQSHGDLSEIDSVVQSLSKTVKEHGKTISSLQAQIAEVDAAAKREQKDRKRELRALAEQREVKPESKRDMPKLSSQPIPLSPPPSSELGGIKKYVREKLRKHESACRVDIEKTSNSLSELVDRYESDVGELTDKLTEVINQVKQSQGDLSQLDGNLESVTKTISDCVAKSKSIERQVTDLSSMAQKDRKDRKRDLETLTQGQEHLTRQFSELRAQHDDQMKLTDGNFQQFATAFPEQLEKLRTDFRQKLKKIEEKRKDQIGVTSETLTTLTAQVNQGLGEVREQLADVAEKINESHGEVSQLDERLEAFTNTIKDCVTNLNAFQTQVQELESSSKQERKESRRKIIALGKKQDELTLQLTDLQRQHEEQMNATDVNFEQFAVSLPADLQKLREEFRQRMKKIEDKSKVQSDTISNALTSLTSQINTELDGVKQSVSGLINDVTRCQTSVGQIDVQVQTLGGAVNDHASNISDVQNQIDELTGSTRKDRKDCKREVDALRKIHQDLSRQFAEFAQQGKH